MNLAEDLLEQAGHLAKREPRRPRQASLRRAVSAAYYALFHLLTAEAALLLTPNLPLARRADVQRWFDHGEMKKVCQQFRSSSLQKPASLSGLHLSSPLQRVASAFVNLQEARHKADYDMATSWTRISVQQQVALAADAFAAWKQIQGTEEHNIFLLCLLLWKQFEKERP